ncbi:hypothetical protein Tco_0811354 [Tanacetum coccineum]
MFYQNRPFLLPYNNKNSFYQSSTGLYRPTMDSSTSYQANQPYSLLNRVTLDMNFEQLMNTQEYYQTQDYSMGQGSAHGSAYGSALVDDDDESPVEEMSPVKAKKASKRASRAKKNDIKENEPPKDWTKAKEITKLVQREGAKKSKTSETISGSASGCFNLNNKANEYEEEAREHRPMGHDALKAKKKSPASSREGSSSFVDFVAEKYLGIKSIKWEKMQEQQDSYIQLKNRELDIQEVARKEAAELKRAKLEIQRQKLQLAGEKKRDKDILFYNSVIDPLFARNTTTEAAGDEG